MKWSRLSLTALLCASLEAQETVATDDATNTLIPEAPPTPEEAAPRSLAKNASIFNDGEARTMTLSIPAPRGLILDREGRPLAQTKMGYHVALDFSLVFGLVSRCHNRHLTQNSAKDNPCPL